MTPEEISELQRQLRLHKSLVLYLGDLCTAYRLRRQPSEKMLDAISYVRAKLIEETPAHDDDELPP